MVTYYLSTYLHNTHTYIIVRCTATVLDYATHCGANPLSTRTSPPRTPTGPASPPGGRSTRPIPTRWPFGTPSARHWTLLPPPPVVLREVPRGRISSELLGASLSWWQQYFSGMCKLVVNKIINLFVIILAAQTELIGFIFNFFFFLQINHLC